MINFGQFRQGDLVSLPLVTRTAAGVATAPSAHPAARIYDSAGALVAAALVPPLDRYKQTGLFAWRLQLDGDFPAGLYGVVMFFTVAGVALCEEGVFEVIAGGSEEGAVVSMTSYERPHAKFLVRQFDDGTRGLGRNPSV